MTRWFVYITMAFLLLPMLAASQSVSGMWKGYIVESDFRQYEQRYNLQLEIEQLPMNVIRCTTTIYKKKVLTSRATGQGLYNTRHHYIIFSEIKFIQLNDSIDKEPCLMACQLTYSNQGRETLTGFFRSKKGADYCSEGKVYLKRFIPAEEKALLRQERKEKRIERKTKRKELKAARTQ